MATQSSDRSCRVYQIAQDGGGSGSSGRLAVKCCNVIKSCIVAPDEGSGEPPRLGEGCAIAVERSTATDAETNGAVATTVSGGGPERRTEPAVVAGAPADIAAITSGAQGSGVSEGCGGNEDASFTDVDHTKDKAKPVQRKNLFVDETVTSFFRRLSWSPDGAFLITPTAQHWDAATKKTQFCTYLFTRGHFVKPAVCLPGLNKPSVAVRCNPRLFILKGRTGRTESESVEPPMCDLPYRAVFAVVSLDAVVVYDTEHTHPLTVATGLHYSGLTDACWSSDGLSLFVSSTDGYVSKIHFQQGELGVTIPESEVPSQTRRLHPVIYNWKPETTHVEEACRLPKPVPVANESQPPTSREKGDETVRDAPGPPTMATKQKKKIVPTLVTPGLRLQVDVEPAPPSTAVPPSPTPPSAERKKRRITPTLVDSNGVDAIAQGANGREDICVAPGTQDVSSSSPGKEAPLLVPPAALSGTGQDRTPKKKRVAPTLVSAL